MAARYIIPCNLRRRYPWRQMNLNDHFYAPYRPGRSPHYEQCYIIRQACRMAKLTGRKWTTRQMLGGVYVRRIL